MQAQESDLCSFQMHARWLTTHVGMSPMTKHVYVPRMLDSTENRYVRVHVVETVLVVRRIDTGVNTAEEGCEERAAAELQA